MTLTRAGQILLLGVIAATLWSARSVALDFLRTFQSARWPKTEAYVTLVGHDFGRSVRDDEKIVRYRYQVSGSEYSGATINFSRRAKWDVEEARRIAEIFSAKQRIDVAFNPEAPAISVIFPGGSNWLNGSFLAMQLSIVTLSTWLIVRCGGRKRPTSRNKKA